MCTDANLTEDKKLTEHAMEMRKVSHQNKDRRSTNYYSVGTIAELNCWLPQSV